jgi:hypothetical protein
MLRGEKMRKGMELSLNVLVIAIVLLVAAIVMITIFSKGISGFWSDMLSQSCQGKLKAMCTPDGAGDDENRDGISDTKSFSLIGSSGTVVASGSCSQGTGETATVSADYAGACKKYEEDKKKAAESR